MKEAPTTKTSAPKPKNGYTDPGGINSGDKKPNNFRSTSDPANFDMTKSDKK